MRGCFYEGSPATAARNGEMLVVAWVSKDTDMRCKMAGTATLLELVYLL